MWSMINPLRITLMLALTNLMTSIIIAGKTQDTASGISPRTASCPSNVWQRSATRRMTASLRTRFSAAASEEGEAGDELEGVDAAAHEVLERDAAGELVADCVFLRRRLFVTPELARRNPWQAKGDARSVACKQAPAQRQNVRVDRRSNR